MASVSCLLPVFLGLVLVHAAFVEDAKPVATLKVDVSEVVAAGGRLSKWGHS